MKTMDAIQKRVSVRAFTPKPVSKEVVKKLLQAGIIAPSGFNSQPWKFYVVTGRKKKEIDAMLLPCADEGVRFTERKAGIDAKIGGRIGRHKTEYTIAMFQYIKEQNSTFKVFAERILRHYDAPVVIFLTMERLRQNVFAMGAAYGAAIENIMIAAFDHGLGACWVTFPYLRTKSAAPKIMRYLNIPANEKIISSIALGYPDEQSPLSYTRMPRDEFDSFVEWIGWD